MITSSGRLVRPEAEAPGESWDDPVRGVAHFVTLSGSPDGATHSLTSGILTLRPGGWVGLHRHRQPEIYYVLEGAPTLVVDGEEQTLLTGWSAFIPGEAEHGIHNEQDAPARVHYVIAADSLDEVDYRFRADSS